MVAYGALSTPRGIQIAIKKQEWMLMDKLSGLCYIISICHHIHLHSFNPSFLVFCPERLNIMDCLDFLASVWVQPMMSNYGQEIYTSLPVKPELVEDTFFN